MLVREVTLGSPIHTSAGAGFSVSDVAYAPHAEMAPHAHEEAFEKRLGRISNRRRWIDRGAPMQLWPARIARTGSVRCRRSRSCSTRSPTPFAARAMTRASR